MSLYDFSLWSEAGIDTLGFTSGQHKVFCPQCHRQRKPEHQRERELSINLDEGVYHCHNCDWSGTVKERPDAPPAKVYVRPVPPEDRRISAPAQALLTQRKINLAVALEAGLYTDGEWLAFPYTRDGQTVHIKYRKIASKGFRCEEDTEHIAYGLDWCADADTVVITEGELDALACRTAGINAVLSVPDGADSGAQRPFRESLAPIVERARRVVLATDGDAAGEKLFASLTDLIGAEKIARVQWPDGSKDANEVLIRHGADALKALIHDAPWLPVPGLIDADEMSNEFMRLYRGDTDPSFDSGIATLDEHYRVGMGQLTVVTGISFHGKTTFLDFLLLQYLKRHNWHVAIFSPEQYPPTRHAAVLAAQLTGKAMPSQWRYQKDVMTEAEAADAIRWVNQHVTFLDPDSPTVDAILDRAAVVVNRTGAKGLVIDPWNEISHERTFMSETLYTGDVLRRFKTFARTHDCHVWLVAHPTKLPKMNPNDPNEKETIPGLEHISGSNNFRNKADMGITVWRDVRDMEKQNHVLVRITKAKHRDFGLVGDVFFGYVPGCHRFYEFRGPVTQKGL